MLAAALAWAGPDPWTGATQVLGVTVEFGADVALAPGATLDSSAALMWLVRDGARALVQVPGLEVRHLARRLLALPLEIDAPRPLSSAEHAVACLAGASLLAERGLELLVEPWQPLPDLRAALARTERLVADWRCLAVPATLDGRRRQLRVWLPPGMELSRPLGRRPFLPALPVPALVVVATAPLARADLARLAVRDVVIVEPARVGAELWVARGKLELRGQPGQTHATVETGYRRRAMEPLPDDLEVELSVTIGTLTLSLRQLSELSVGQVVSLGRPLAGPFELRAGGRVIGAGELVDVDGALGVRVTALHEG